MDDGGSESEDGPIDLTLAGTEDSDEEAATEAEKDFRSCSSEPPDESTRDTSLGSTSPRGASPRYTSPRYASPRYASPQYAHAYCYASSDFPTSWYQSNPRFPAGDVIPLTQHPLPTWGRVTSDEGKAYTSGQQRRRWTGTGSHKCPKKMRVKTASGLPASLGNERITTGRQSLGDIGSPKSGR